MAVYNAYVGRKGERAPFGEFMSMNNVLCQRTRERERAREGNHGNWSLRDSDLRKIELGSSFPTGANDRRSALFVDKF